MIGICRDCRWWFQEEWEVPRSIGTCVLTRYGRAGIADNPRPEETKARAQGEDGWAARLETDPDFGCVQFESREDEP